MDEAACKVISASDINFGRESINHGLPQELLIYIYILIYFLPLVIKNIIHCLLSFCKVAIICFVGLKNI